ncbi:hypothetical protein [Phyllobacterium zundukense]|uniref:Uncharacterized protein n=1 Tax=Phyllobacterium zundukense TaxID=1867719 RepID=A0ACD4CZV4_9HYPH|nr:hypothetical protein [Phyllobacterium zundukense]UXN59135.1 hypothetical protein N8E88_09715 [Phyllobacterium zundukense]
MDRAEATIKELRVELSNLRDDLAVIESSEVFAARAIGNQEVVSAIRHRIAELESILRLRHHCMHPGCKSWGSFGFDKRDGVEWYCSTHKGDADD